MMTVFSLYIHVTIISVKNQTGNVELNGDSHDYNTRNKNNNAVIQHKLKLFIKSLKYIEASFFNLLPNDIKSLKNHKSFKLKLK